MLSHATTSPRSVASVNDTPPRTPRYPGTLRPRKQAGGRDGSPTRSQATLRHDDTTPPPSVAITDGGGAPGLEDGNSPPETPVEERSSGYPPKSSVSLGSVKMTDYWGVTCYPAAMIEGALAAKERQREEAFAYWLHEGQQSNVVTARDLNIPKGTIDSWAQRYRWRERARAEDREAFGNIVAWGRRKIAAQIVKAVAVNEAALDATYGPDGKPLEGAPTPTALKAADQTLARFGITPTRHTILDVHHQGESATPAQIQAIIASRDTSALLALLQGEPPPDLPGPAALEIEAEVIER